MFVEYVYGLGVIEYVVVGEYVDCGIVVFWLGMDC